MTNTTNKKITREQRREQLKQALIALMNNWSTDQDIKTIYKATDHAITKVCDYIMEKGSRVADDIMKDYSGNQYREDLTQEILTNILEQGELDPNPYKTLYTYANRAVCKCIRQNTKSAAAVHLDKPSKEGESATVADTLQARDNTEQEVIRKLTVQMILDVCTTDRQRALVKALAKGYTQSQYAALVGLNRRTVSDTMCMIRKRVKQQS